MKEYIFYVLLIFMPIGAIMVKILLGQGLPAKNIAYIVLASLSIVVSFPISIERLGAFLAFVTYAIVLALIIVYLVKLEKQIYPEVETNLSSPSIIIPALDNNDGSNKNTVISNNTIMEITATNWLENKIIASEQSLEVPQDNLNAEPSITSDDLPGGVEVEIEHEEVIPDNVEMPGAEDLDEPVNYEKMPETYEEKAEEVEEDEKSVDNIDDVEPIEEIEPIEPVVTEEFNTEPTPIIEEETTAPVIEAALVTTNEIDEPVEIEKKENQVIDETLPLQLDTAFQLKDAGDYNKSIEYFLIIWQNSKDYDLKYLITMELVELYKLIGLYSLAQDLLMKFSNEVQGLNTYIVEGIKRELTFINLLQEEISRLKLDQVPLEKLPRWVKIKVAEMLNQLD